MDKQPTSIQRHRRLVLIAALALVVALGTTSASAASPTACRVQSTDTGKTYGALQPAVDAASKGDRLTVRGTCRGGTVIDKDLVVEGVQGGQPGKPTLSGVGTVRVVEIGKRTHVTMRHLIVTRGKVLHHNKYGSGTGYGGGIMNRGSLTLIDVNVLRSTAGEYGLGRGGGIYNAGTLILMGDTRISRNYSPGGGGVYSEGVMRMFRDSAITSNGAEWGAGVENEGTLTMNDDSRVSGNGAEEDGGVANYGRLVMNDRSTITRNSGALYHGVGGVFNWKTGTVVMNDASSIRDNGGADTGPGGVRNEGGTFTMNDASSISGNGAEFGGGVETWRKSARFTMNDSSSISGNTSTNGRGGGVWVGGGVFTMNDTSIITGNTAAERQEEEDGSTGGGGGLHRTGGTLVGVSCGPDGNVHDNSPDDCLIESP